MQQVYTAHTPSLHIPVLIPSPRHTIPAHYPGHQVVTPQPMAVHTHPSLPFGAQAAALQSKFHATAPRFTEALPQTPSVRTMGHPHRVQEDHLMLQGNKHTENKFFILAFVNAI